MSASLRVAFVTANYDVIPDGVSLTLQRLVGYLDRCGIGHLVLSPVSPGRTAGPGVVPIRSLPAPGRPEYRVALGLPRRARQRLWEFAPSLVHITTPDFLGRQALWAARRRGIPVVASYHTHFSSYLKYYGLEEFEGFLWKYLRRFYRHCEQVYVPSDSIAAVLQAHEIRGLRLWERGVDTARFSPSWRSLEWRRSLGIADHEPVIAFVGRPVWEKGLATFGAVVQHLEAMGIPHRSLVVGEGPATAILLRRLRRTVFTGYLTGTELSRAYASADVFLFPSDTETFGNVTLEAMASGLPAVCADAPGSRSLVVDGQTGFLAEPGRVSAFLDRVLTLVGDTAVRKRMGAAARERATRYEWDATFERLLSYYDEVLGREPPAALAPARGLPRPA